MVKLPLAIRRALCGSSGFDSRPRDLSFFLSDLADWGAGKHWGRPRRGAANILCAQPTKSSSSLHIVFPSQPRALQLTPSTTSRGLFSCDATDRARSRFGADLYHQIQELSSGITPSLHWLNAR